MNLQHFTHLYAILHPQRLLGCDVDVKQWPL